MQAPRFTALIEVYLCRYMQRALGSSRLLPLLDYRNRCIYDLTICCESRSSFTASRWPVERPSN